MIETMTVQVFNDCAQIQKLYFESMAVITCNNYYRHSQYKINCVGLIIPWLYDRNEKSLLWSANSNEYHELNVECQKYAKTIPTILITDLWY